MAISGGTEMLKKISSQIESQFPSFIREEGPNFVAFLKAYFEYMEQAGNATDAVRSIEDLHDIDRTVDGFVEYFRREFMVNIPASVLADKRLLTKHIIEFYRSRGSEQSYRFLFRILFDREIDIYYPGNDILRASDGRWVRESKLRVGEPYSKNPRLFDGIEVRGVESGAKGLVQSIIGARASGLMIYDMTVENVFGNFIDGERVVDADGNYVTVNAQIGPLSGIRLIDGGAFHKQGDLIEISGAGSVSPATAVVDRVRSDSAVTIQLVNGGSGYTKENTRVVVDGDGLGFEAVVASFSSEATVVTLNTDLIRPLANVVLNTGPTFISLGANTSAVSGALAAANLYSTILAAATFSNSAFYAVNAIALINPGYNHSTLPTITILDDEVGLKFESDGYGGYLGRNATVSVSHAPGTIDELRITNPGVDFNRFEYASLLNTSQGNSVITLSSTGTSSSGSPNTKYLSQQTTYSGSAQPEPKGITIFPGRYIDTKGFLSWNNKLQDNYYYQEFSYVIKVSEQLAKYREIVRSLVHPAGAIMFGEYVVRSKADVPHTVAVSRTNLFNILLTENAVALANTLVEISTSHTESVTASESLLASITLPLTETVTSNTAESAQVNFVSSASESITTTSTQSTQVNFVSSASESITTTSTHSAQANFQSIANESFTATDSSTTQTVFQSFANDAYITASESTLFEITTALPTESVTSTDNILTSLTLPFTETVTSTETVEALAVFQSFANEQFTTTDTQSAQVDFAPSISESITSSASQTGERFILISPAYYQVQYANSQIQAYQSAQIQPYAAITSGSLDGTARLVTNTTSGSFFSNGAISANAGSINVGGPGSNLFIVPVGDTLDPNAIYQVNAIFSNTALTLRTEYLPVTSNAQIYYSTGPG